MRGIYTLFLPQIAKFGISSNVRIVEKILFTEYGIGPKESGKNIILN